MTGCGKHGKTIKLFSHPSHSPWKSLPRFSTLHTATTTKKKYLSKTHEAKSGTMMHNTTTQVGQIR